jgi:hypothetical protein
MIFLKSKESFMPKEKDIEKLWTILWVSIKMKEMLGKE